MRRVLSIAIAAFAAVLLIGSPSSTAFAQTSNGLGITPRKDLTIEPGKSITDKLLISNLNNDRELRLTLEVIDFGAKDQSGTPALNLDPTAKQTPWSLRPFIKAPEAVTVPAGKEQYVNFTVTIPQSQGAGSYYSAIRYITAGVNEGNVAVSASGATLVFVTVPGKTKESLTLQKFGAYQEKPGSDIGDYRSLFVKSAPKQMAFTLKNQGNVAEQPAGSILIKNMFGKQVKVVKDVNPKGSLALIDQTRLFDACINPPSREDTDQECKSTSFWPGRYTATLNAFYGINGNGTQEILATASFWYLPTWFLVTLAIVVAGLVLAGYMINRRINGGRSFKRR